MFETFKDIKDIKFTLVKEREGVLEDIVSISEPIAMASNAGWYVGRICQVDYGIYGYETDDPEQIQLEPFDRITEYFSTPEQAVEELEYVSEGGYDECLNS